MPVEYVIQCQEVLADRIAEMLVWFRGGLGGEGGHGACFRGGGDQITSGAM